MFVKNCLRTSCFLLVFLSLSVALGDTDDKGTQSHFYQPPTDPYGFQSIDSAEVLNPLSMHFGLFYDYSKNPVETGTSGDVRVDDVVGDLAVLNAVFGIGLPFGLEAGIVVPFVLEQNGFEIDEPGKRLDSTGFLDLRVDLKWQAFVSEDRKWSVALKGFLTIPSGRQSQFRGEDGEFTAAGLAIGEYRSGRFRALLSVGYQWIEEDAKVGGVRFDDRVLLRGGLEYAIFQYRKRTKAGRDAYRDRREARARRRQAGEEQKDDEWSRYEEIRRGYLKVYEVAIQTSLDSSFRATHPSEELSFPTEFYSGLVMRCSQGVSLIGGVSAGLANGVGSPDYRIYVGLTYTFGEPFSVSHRFRDGDNDSEQRREADRERARR